MTEALLAVQGMTVVVDPLSGVVATIIVAPPTAPVLGDNKIAHQDGDQITVTAITAPAAGGTVPDPGPYIVGMVATAEYDFTQDTLLLKEGDESEIINASPETGGGTPVPVSFKCIVTAAGQTVAYIS